MKTTPLPLPFSLRFSGAGLAFCAFVKNRASFSMWICRLAATGSLLALTSCVPSCESRIYGLEVTQSVQSYPGQDVPLVADKLTIVRMYVKPVSGGITAYHARLTVRRLDNGVPGNPVTVAPIPPYDVVTHTTPPKDFRYEPDKGFMFWVPSDLLGEGDIQLEAELLDQADQPIADTPHYTRTVSFIKRLWFSYYGERYMYSTTGATCTGMAGANVVALLSELYSQVPYMQSLMPVASVVVLANGNPNVVPSFDNSDCKGIERASAYAAKVIDSLHPEGGHRYYLLQPDKNNGYFGSTYSTGRGNLVTYAQNLLADEGPTLAHELSHSWGLWWHTFDSAGPYPRKDGTLGINPGIKTYLRHPPAVVAPRINDKPAAFDLMSYSPPFWVSDFTYCELLRNISTSLGAPTECRSVYAAERALRFDPIGTAYAANLDIPVSKPGSIPTGIASSSEDQRAYTFISGSVGPGDQAFLNPLETFASDADLSSRLIGDTWRLIFRGRRDEILKTYPFDPPLNSGRDPQTPRSFAFFVPYDRDTTRIELARNDRILAELKSSKSTPEVTFSSVPTEKVNGTKRIEWQAHDTDGDPLRYSLWYSRDAGAHWLPIAVDYSKTSFDVDFDRLPASDAAMLRVLASDGFHTTAVRTTMPFQVSSSNAIVQIGIIPPGKESRDVRAVGSAFSWSEGVISEPARYYWSLDGRTIADRGTSVVFQAVAPGQHQIDLKIAGRGENEYRSSNTVLISVP